MRDVTPVEALDAKLACMHVMTRGARDVQDRSLGEQGLTLRNLAAATSRQLQGATPVAWSTACMDTVASAAHSYPVDEWPPLTRDGTFRLYVFPRPLHQIWSEDALAGHGEVWRVLVGVRSRIFIAVFFRQDGIPVYWRNKSLDESPCPPSEQSPELNVPLYQFLFASQAFLDQRIAIEERAHVERQAKKRAERLDVDPVVHVVRFRKAEAHPHSCDAASSIEWSCQWLVRGHWRNQWHPRLQRHAPAWIAPHIKGPADMPLKTPAPEVWQVVR